MSLLSEISRTVVNAQTYTGPGGSINTSATTNLAPSYIQRGQLASPVGSSTGASLIPAFSYNGTTMVMPNALVSGAAQMLVYAQAADKTYSVSSILPIPDTTNANYCMSAVSYDGSVCVFGSNYDGANNGKVVVFRLVSGVWTRIFSASGAPGERLGFSVSISGDGTKIAVGGIGGEYVNVYARSGNVVVLAQKLTGLAAGMDPGAEFSFSCSLSGDGQVLAVGAPSNNLYFGCVVTYRLINKVWSQQSTLVPVGVTNTTSSPRIGESVSLDYSAVTMVVGCIQAGLQRVDLTGCVVVYTSLGGVWTQGQTIIPYDVQPSPNPSVVGYSVSMSADGQTLSFDGYDDFTQQGGVWIFARGADGLWSANGSKRVGTGYTIATGVVEQYCGIMSPDASVLAVVSDSYNDASDSAFWIFA